MVSVADNFNRANGGLGPNWISSPDLSPPGHQPQISGSTVTGQVSNEAEAAYWSDLVDTFAPDQFAQVTVGAQGGPLVRHQAGHSSYYLAFGDVGNNSIVLSRCDSGVLTELGSWTGISSGDVLRIEVLVADFTVKKNGTALFGTFTDATYPGGQPGLHVFGTAAAVDNFAAGPIVLAESVAAASGTGGATGRARSSVIGLAVAAGTGLASAIGSAFKRSVAAAIGVGEAIGDGTTAAPHALGFGAAFAVGASTAASVGAAYGEGGTRGIMQYTSISTITMQTWDPTVELRVG